MGIPITDTLVSDSTAPIVSGSQVKGGGWNFPTNIERDAVPLERQEIGALCYVSASDEYYKLTVLGEPPTWATASLGGAGGGSLVFDTIAERDAYPATEGMSCIVLDDGNGNPVEYVYLPEDLWDTTTSIIALVTGSGISVDDSDPAYPIISATGGGGGVLSASYVLGTTQEDQTLHLDSIHGGGIILQSGSIGTGSFAALILKNTTHATSSDVPSSPYDQLSPVLWLKGNLWGQSYYDYSVYSDATEHNVTSSVGCQLVHDTAGGGWISHGLKLVFQSSDSPVGEMLRFTAIQSADGLPEPSQGTVIQKGTSGASIGLRDDILYLGYTGEAGPYTPGLQLRDSGQGWPAFYSTAGGVSLVGLGHPVAPLNHYYGTDGYFTLDSIGSGSTVGLTLRNTTAATASLQQNSPMVVLEGQAWDTDRVYADITGSSVTASIMLQMIPEEGASPRPWLHLSQSVDGVVSDWVKIRKGDYCGIVLQRSEDANLPQQPTLLIQPVTTNNVGLEIYSAHPGWVGLKLGYAGYWVTQNDLGIIEHQHVNQSVHWHVNDADVYQVAHDAYVFRAEGQNTGDAANDTDKNFMRWRGWDQMHVSSSMFRMESYAGDTILRVDRSGSLSLINPIPAIDGVQQNSPLIELQGAGWATDTASSVSSSWAMQVQMVSGLSTPTGSLAFLYAVSGSAYVEKMSLSPQGLLARQPVSSSLNGTMNVSLLDRMVVGDATSGDVTYILPHPSSSAGIEYTFTRKDGSINSVYVSSSLLNGSSTAQKVDQYMISKVFSDGVQYYMHPVGA